MSFKNLPTLPAQVTIIWEDYRGNLHQAHHEVKQAYAKTTTSSLQTHLQTKLMLGILCWLQGDLKQARTYIDAVIAQSDDDPKLRLRAHSYHYLIEYFAHLGSPASASLMTLAGQSDWSIESYAKKHEIEWQNLIKKITDSWTTLETTFIHDILQNVLVFRLLTDGMYLMDQQKINALLPKILAQPMQFRAQAQDGSVQVAAYVDRLLAEICWRADYIDDARNFLGSAFERYKNSADEHGEALCWMLLGDRMCAPTSTPLVWNYIIQEGDWSNQLSPIREAQEFSKKVPDIETAKVAYESAEELFSNLDAQRGIAMIHLRRAYLAALDNNYSDVIFWAKSAYEKFHQTGDMVHAQLARTHELMGLVGLDKVDKELAVSIAQWGKSSEQINYAKGLAIFCVRVARGWQTLQGDYDRTIACVELAQKMFEEVEAKDNVAQCLFDRGRVYLEIGDRIAALASTESAYEIYTRLVTQYPKRAKASWQKQVMVLDQVSAIYLGMPDAPANLQRSIERLEELSNTEPTNDSLELFGEETFATTVRDQVQMRLELSQVMSRVMQAADKRAAGYPDEAEKLLKQAYNRTETVSNEQKDFLQANVLRVLKDYDKAAQAFQRFLDAGGIRANFTGELVQKMIKRFAGAGQALADTSTPINFGFAMQFFVRVQHYELAQQYADTLDEIGTDSWLYQDINVWERLTTFGELHEGLGQFQQALGYYDDAIRQLEKQRITFRQDHHRNAFAGTVTAQALYFYAARTAIKIASQTQSQQQQYIAQAFRYAEQGRTRSLLDMIGSHSTTVSDKTLQLRQLNARLSQYRKLLTQELNAEQPTSELIERYRQKVQQDEAAFRHLTGQLPKSLSTDVSPLNKLQTTLSVDMLLLEYYFLEDDLLIWQISRDDVSVHHRKIDHAEINQFVRQFIEAIRSRDANTILTVGSKLRSILLEPCRDNINNFKRLVIVPYGSLYRLPIQALPWDNDQPLITTHILSQLPSANTLNYIQQPAINVQSSKALVVGNPSKMAYVPPNVLNTKPVPQQSLSAAESEALYVASRFITSVLFTRDSATKANFLAALDDAKAVIHLATHSVLSDNTPLLSAILFANGETLTVDELIGMTLNTQLIVLSACNTGSGEITRGGDVDGLMRGVLTAGANATILSLWAVDDVSTSLLMGKFYDYLQNYDVAEAMQQAQKAILSMSKQDQHAAIVNLQNGVDEYRNVRSIRFGKIQANSDSKDRDFRHAYFWSPFVYIGI